MSPQNSDSSDSSPEQDYPSPPGSSSSTASSTLPTPCHPFQSRQNSISNDLFISPTLGAHRPSLSPPYTGFENYSVNTFIPPLNINTRGSIPDMIVSMPSPVDHHRGDIRGFSFPKSGHHHRPRSHSNRAPPPPPILLHKANKKGRNNEKATISPRSPSHNTTLNSPDISPRNSLGGLNIAGLATPSTSTFEEDDSPEEEDKLADLLHTPHRSFFANAQADGAPVSPAWQSFETSPRMGSPRMGSPLSGTPRRTHRSRGSEGAVAFSPLGPASRPRFDSTPQNGIHARNLSIFFPHPGQPQPNREELSPTFTQENKVLPAGGLEKQRNVFGGTGEWTFGQSASIDLKDDGSLDPLTAESKPGKRRGHHHRHSLSHNFFSFLDPTKTDPALAALVDEGFSPRSSTSKTTDTPTKVPMLLAAPVIVPSEPVLSPLPKSKSSSQIQMLASFALLEFFLGAGLWVEGQMSGWRCLAGLGYLIVFDAMGVGVTMLGKREIWSNIRRPYGSARFLSLMYFVQSLFLVFAAVYIAKEALEQVVLGSGAHEHAGSGAHGHGEVVLEGDERPFPQLLLAAAVFASAFSGAILGNHSKLVQAVGPLFLSGKSAPSKKGKKYPLIMFNPFSLTIAGTSLMVLIGSFVVPLSSMSSLDSALSLLLTLATAALSYPPTLAFGHVLLQTAPPPTAPQMKQLKRVLKDIGNDNRILGVGTLRCWSIGATIPEEVPSRPTSSPVTPANSVPNSPRFASTFSDPPQSPSRLVFNKIQDDITPLVVSLTLHVHPDTSDRDVLEVTKWAWTKVNGAVGMKRKGTSEGEVTIGVKRGWKGVEAD